MAAKASQSHLYVTHVDAVGNYLKFYGVSNVEALNILDQKMQNFLPNCMAIDPTWPLERHESHVQKDLVCLYKGVKSSKVPSETTPSKFMRVRVIKTTRTNPGPRKALLVEAEFIDYGYTKEVRSYELLIPNQVELLKKIPPLCNDYILLGICGEWSSNKLYDIKKIVQDQSLDITIVYELYKEKFIKMKWKGFDFVEYLILHLNIGAGPVTDDIILEHFKEQEENQKKSSSPLNSNSIAGKSLTINNNNYSNANKNMVVNSKTNLSNNTDNNNVQYFNIETQQQDYLTFAQRKSVAARLRNIQISPPRHPLPFVGSNRPSAAPIPPGGRLPGGSHFINTSMPNYYQQAAMPYGAAYYSSAMMRQRQPHVLPALRFTAQPLQPFPIPLHKQQQYQASASLMVSKRLQPPPAAAVPASNELEGPSTAPRKRTYKTYNLTIGQTYDVVVSFAENGPLLFSVQLVKLQDQLCEMMNAIEKEEYELKKLHLEPNKPFMGVCIARYSEDNHLYRALVINVQRNTCKVVYVDYGNWELVSFNNLYEIPDKFLEEKAFALPFCLSGSKSLEPIDDSIKKAFSEKVIFKPCILKVVPLEGPPLLQYCELQHMGEDMLGVLKNFQSKRNVYPKAENLKDSDVVEIRYIDSPKRFFVQKVSNIAAFHKLMDEMFTYYNKNQVVPSSLNLGDPCIVKCENDWYRGEVIRDDNSAIIIRHVDFGYEQKVTRNLLSVIASKHLKMPRQAVQCCLKGFETNEIKKDLATTQFEMLAEDSQFQRRAFSVKVFRLEPNGVNLVNLFTKDLNVMKKLYKLSMPFDEYVSLERSDFNFSKKNSLSQAGKNGGQKASSILHSTTLLSDENRHKEKEKDKEKDKDKNLTTSPSKQKSSQSPLPPSPASSSHQNSNEMNRHSSNYQARSPNKPSHNAKNQSNKENFHNENIRKPFPAAQIKNFPRSPEKLSANHGGGGGTGSDNVSLNSSLSAGSLNKSQKSQRSSASRTPRQKTQNSPRNTPQGYSNSPFRKPQEASLPASAPAPPTTPSNHQNTSPSSSSSSPSNQNQKTLSNKAATEEYLPMDQNFPKLDIKIPSLEEVDLCWWVSPYQFYTYHKKRLADFENLNQQIQQFYKNKPSYQHKVKINASVVIYCRKEKLFLRARVLASKHMVKKYKVLCVDNGRQVWVSSEDIWQVEKRFASFPCMAYECSFKGIVCNYDHLHIITLMKKYLPANAHLSCEYLEYKNSIYYVNVRINKLCLKERLIADNILWPVDLDMSLDLLAGQQIRAKFSSITNMMNFKIQIDGCDPNIRLICSYDDIRFVKSNIEATEKFKEFYENKSFVVNIKNVNEHKVIFLKPLMPLFKDDIVTYIPTYPIVMKNFHGHLLHVALPHRIYCVAMDEVKKCQKLFGDMMDYYESSGEVLHHVEKDGICAVKSKDGKWYRGRIRNISQKSDKVEVYFLDSGNIQCFRKSFLKKLEERFYLNISAFAIEINLPLRTNTDLLHSSKKSNETKNENDMKIEKALHAHLYRPTINIEAFEVRNNRLIADVFVEEVSIVDLLEKEKLIIGRDLDYMRKVLDKEKPNIWEYIEMVDLTLEEDEDDQQQAEPSPPSPPSDLIEKEKDLQTTNGLKEKPEEDILEKEWLVVNGKELENLEIEIPSESNGVLEEETATSTPSNLSPIKSSPKSLAEDPYVDMEQAILSHCDNPAQFFVHLRDRIDDLYKLQEDLQIVASSLPPLMCIANGANCISLYSVSDQWCRAKILDAELLVIRYTDFGNTDWISDASEIKEMSVVPTMEPFCIPCALPIRPNGTADWVDAANAIFNDSYYKKLYFEYITHGDYEKKSFINLFIDGVNVADKLVQDGFAKHMVLVDNGETCYISHLNNICDFYIQYEKNSKGLELIECHLADVQNLQALKEFEKGKIVAALFPDDEMWYRAELQKVLPDGSYEVLFIDYGNTSISPECKEISEAIAKLPPLSTKCSLALPEDCVAWSEAAEDKFAEISATGETIFTVDLVEPGNDRALVQLFIDGVNVNEDLKALCELKALETEAELNHSFGNTTLQTTFYEPDILYDALVYHVNSMADFYIQFKKNSERLEDINSSLNSLALEDLKSVEVGEMCATIFEVDNLLYRARVLEKLDQSPEHLKCRCLLVDYGNEVVTEVFKALPQDLIQIQDLSKQCQLSSLDSFADCKEKAEEAFLKVLKETEFSIKVNVLNNESLPALVKVYNENEEDLEEKILALLDDLNPKGPEEDSKDSLELEDDFEEANGKYIISHCLSPDHFYLQLKNKRKLDIISKILMTNFSNKTLKNLENPCFDEWCVVYSHEDDCCYRGRIQDIGKDSFSVFLFDFGNNLDTQDVYEIPENLKTIIPLAKKCSLKGFESLDFEVDFVKDKFNDLIEMHFGESYDLIEKTFDDKQNLYEVRLQINYKDLLKELQEFLEKELKGEKESNVIPVLHTCNIVCSQSPQSFYIHLEKDLQAVEDLKEALANIENESERPSSLKEGDLVAAFSEEYDGYYRAKILSYLEDEDRYSINFIDYGNDGTSNKLFNLPDKFLKMKPFSKHCSLGKDFTVKSVDFVENFRVFISSRFGETFQIEFINSETDPIICRLFIKNKNVIDEVLQMIEAELVSLPPLPSTSSTASNFS